MIYQMLSSEYLFWLTAIIFYIFSTIKLVDESELLIIESLSGKYKPSFSFSQFQIKGRNVFLLNPLIPFTGFIKLNFSPCDDPSINFNNTIKEMDALKTSTFPFRIISIFSFGCLIGGPILTYLFGLRAAFIIITPLHITSLVFTITLLLTRRSSLGLNREDIISIFLDFLFMPAYLPSIVRKIYSKKRLSCDGNYFSLQTCSAVDREELIHNISRNIHRYSERFDDGELIKFQLYKEKLGMGNDKQ